MPMEEGHGEDTSVLAIRCRLASCTNRQTELNLFQACARCGAKYCSRECQIKDWKTSHKLICKTKGADSSPLVCTRVGDAVSDQEAIAQTLSKLAAYSAPFVVYQQNQIGKGVLFVQSQQDAAQFRYTGQLDDEGARLQRTLIFQYVSQEELEQEIAPHIPSIAKHKGMWNNNLNKYKPRSQIVLLMKMGCGYSTCTIVPLEPTYQLCLGAVKDNLAMYQAMDQLEINLDADDQNP